MSSTPCLVQTLIQVDTLSVSMEIQQTSMGYTLFLQTLNLDPAKSLLIPYDTLEDARKMQTALLSAPAVQLKAFGFFDTTPRVKRIPTSFPLSPTPTAKAVEEFPGYWVTPEAMLYKEKLKSNGEVLFSRVSTNVNRYGFVRANFNKDGKQTTKTLHSVVYETFKGVPTSELVFLDGDKTHCALENLVSIEELIACYRKHH